MKPFLFVALLFSISAPAAPRTRKLTECAVVKRAIQYKLGRVGKFMDASYGSFDTQSDIPRKMIQEFMKSSYGTDIEDEAIGTDIELVQPDNGVGTVTKEAAIESLIDNVKVNYLTDEDGARLDAEEARELLQKVEKAAIKLTSHPELRFGYHGGAQGWGGSSASELLVLNPRCKVLYSLFLGINHG